MAPKEKRTCDGILFASKKEMLYYQELKLRKSGSFGGFHFLRQISFPLPGGISYRCDFLTFQLRGGEASIWEIEVIDVKGVRTGVYLLKKKLFEETYPWKIREV